MTKTKALLYGTTSGVWSIGALMMHWWLVGLLTLAIVAYFLWLFAAKYRRDRRFAALSGYKRIIPHTHLIETSDNSDLLVSGPFQTNDERS